MVEDVDIDGDRVQIPAGVRKGQFIMPRAEIFGKGERVLQRGTYIRPIEVGLLSEVGRHDVRCYSKPSVAVLPTGDELVGVSEMPGPGQIRNSNGPMLEARATLAGCQVISLGVGKDDKRELAERISYGAFCRRARSVGRCVGRRA